MKYLALCCLALLGVAVWPVRAAGPMIFETINDYRALPSAQGLAYVMGVVDGYSIAARDFSPFNDPSQSFEQILARCMQGKTNQQMQAMFEKFSQANPSEWHTPAALTIRNVLLYACPDEFKQLTAAIAVVASRFVAATPAQGPAPAPKSSALPGESWKQDTIVTPPGAVK